MKESVPLVGARYIFVNAGGPFLCQKQLKFFCISIFSLPRCISLNSFKDLKKKQLCVFVSMVSPSNVDVVKCNETKHFTLLVTKVSPTKLQGGTTLYTIIIRNK